MSDENRPPENDWSPDDSDIDGGQEPWGWLDDAVDAWDHTLGADAAPTVDGGFDSGDLDTSHLDSGDLDAPNSDDEAPVPASLSGDDREPGPVELFVPDDLADDGRDADDDFEDAGLLAFPVGEPVGTCSTAALAEALTLLGVEDSDAVLSGLGDGRVDARDAVGALDFAGIPARVEHAGIGELLERLAAGDEVLLGGGEPHALVAIDPAGGEVVVEPLAGGARTTLAISAFEDAWDETANELMVLNSDNPGILLGGGEVCVLPVAVSDIL